MTATSVASRTQAAAAKRRRALSSLARYASMLDGRGRLRTDPSLALAARFSPIQRAICSGGRL